MSLFAATPDAGLPSPTTEVAKIFADAYNILKGAGVPIHQANSIHNAPFVHYAPGSPLREHNLASTSAGPNAASAPADMEINGTPLSSCRRVRSNNKPINFQLYSKFMYSPPDG